MREIRTSMLWGLASRISTRWHAGMESLLTLPFGHAAWLSGTLFTLIAIVDLVTPPDLDLTFLYAFLIVIAAWNTNMRFALTLVVLAFALQLLMLTGLKSQFSEPFYFYVSLGNRLFTLVLAVGLIAPLKAMYARERSLARIDFATGIGNRQAFRERLEVEISRLEREGFPFSLAYLDADNFKAVNDRAGHEEGDRALVEIARTLIAATRKTDYVARLGGDEFGILFHHSDQDVARHILARVRKQVAERMAAHQWPITLSAGLGTFEGKGLTPDAAMSYCDELLYCVKRDRKNDVAFGRYAGEQEQRRVAGSRD